jgi:hypothetical protein
MSKHENNLTERIQVLLSKDDMIELNIILYEIAIAENRKPDSVSKYLRTTIKKLIEDYKNKK